MTNDAYEPSAILEPSSVQTAQVERSSVGARAAVVVVVLALLGAGLYGVNSFLAPAGAGSSTDAVQQMLDAVADEDFVAAAELVAPAERRSIINPSFEIVGELSRLEILDPDLDLSSLAGIDFEFTDVTLSTEPLGPGVEMVYFDSGRSTVRTDPDELPIGSVVEDLVADFDADMGGPVQESRSMASDDLGLAVIEVDGRWYVSLWYTVAEGLRREAGVPLPTFGEGPTPVGGENPDAAVRGLIEAGIDLDLEAMIAMLPPDEAAALYDYSPLFLDDGQAAIDGLVANVPGDFSWGLTELTTTSKVDGDKAVVQVERFGFEVTAPDVDASILWDGECLHWEVTDDGWVDVGDSCGATAEALDGIDLDIELPSMLTDLDTSGMGVVVRQVDGRWYVSPFESMFETYLVVLRQIEQEDIDEMVDFVGEVMLTGLGSFVGTTGAVEFDDIADSIGDGPVDPDGDDDYFVPSTNENEELIAPGFGEGWDWDFLDVSDLDPEWWPGTFWDLDMAGYVRGSEAWTFNDDIQTSLVVAEFIDSNNAADQFAGLFDTSFDPTGPDTGPGDQVAQLSAYENEPGEDPYGSGQWLMQVGRFVVTVDVYGSSYDEVATMAEAFLVEAADHLGGL